MTKHEESMLSKLASSHEGRMLYAESALETEVHALISDAVLGERLSQTELGKRLGVTRARANQILSGENQNLTLGLMGRIAGALGMRWKVELLDLDSAVVMYSYEVSPLTHTEAKFHPTRGIMSQESSFLRKVPASVNAPVPMHRLSWDNESVRFDLSPLKEAS